MMRVEEIKSQCGCLVYFKEIKENKILSISDSGLKVYAKGFVKGVYIDEWIECKDNSEIAPKTFRFKSIFDKRPRKAKLAIVNVDLYSTHTIELKSNRNGQSYVIKDKDGLYKALNITLSFDYQIKEEKFAIGASNSVNGLGENFLKENNNYKSFIDLLSNKFREVVHNLFKDINFDINNISDLIKDKLKDDYNNIMENNIYNILNISNLTIDYNTNTEELTDFQKNENRRLLENAKTKADGDIEKTKIITQGDNDINKTIQNSRINEENRNQEVKDAQIKAAIKVIEAKGNYESEKFVPVGKRLYDYVDKHPEILKEMLEMLNRDHSILGNNNQSMQTLLSIIFEDSSKLLSQQTKTLVDEKTNDEVYE